jgi:hypothetical protein
MRRLLARDTNGAAHAAQGRSSWASRKSARITGELLGKAAFAVRDCSCSDPS